MSKDLIQLNDTVMAAQEAFNRVVSANIEFQQEAQFALQALEQNNFLMSVAMNNPKSLRNAVLNVAAIGITLNPAQKFAYLVPRDGKVCLDLSYMGLARLATDSGSVLWVQAEVVRKRDDFKLSAVGQKPEHNFSPFSDRGEIVGVYCVIKTADGEFLTTVMSAQECYEIRDRTESYKAYTNGKIKTCPWVSDVGEMMKKTVIKRAYKLWPRSERLAKAVEAINEHEGIDFAKEKEMRDITPPQDDKLAELRSMVGMIEGGAGRLLSYLSKKYKLELTCLEDLTQEHVAHAIDFLKGFIEKQEKEKKNEVQNENA